MAATAAMGSSLSPSSLQSTLKCLRQKIPLLPFSSASISYHSSSTPDLSLSTTKWRNLQLKISAAVAQEEAVAAVVVEAVEEEEAGDNENNGIVGTLNTKIYFGNLPYNVDSAMLAGIIQEHANPELVEVLYDRNTGRSRGFAFVTMTSIEDCDKVIKNLDGTEYLGRTLRVNLSDKPKSKEPLYPETEYKLFVGNLSWSVTSESLTQAFQEYGNVVGARVLFDGESGKSRGYGFVSYPTKSEMDAAMQSLDGVELEGRPLRVSLAEGRRS